MGSDKTKKSGDDVEPQDSKKATVIMKAFVLPEETPAEGVPTDMESSDTDGGVDVWAEWDPADPEEYWYRVYKIEEAGAQGEEAYAIALAGYGLRDKDHFQKLRETFARHVTDPKAFEKAAETARARASAKE
jgi:hypothetical protein